MANPSPLVIPREPCIETVKDPHIEAYCNTTKSVGLILFVFPASLAVCLAMPSLVLHICLPCACLMGTVWLPYFYAHPSLSSCLTDFLFLPSPAFVPGRACQPCLVQLHRAFILPALPRQFASIDPPALLYMLGFLHCATSLRGLSCQPEGLHYVLTCLRCASSQLACLDSHVHLPACLSIPACLPDIESLPASLSSSDYLPDCLTCPACLPTCLRLTPSLSVCCVSLPVCLPSFLHPACLPSVPLCLSLPA